MSEDPREALLDVARDIVAKRGYLGLTMRTASAAAGVTPDVARRYYRNRDSLFAAAMRLPADPVSAIPTLMAPGIEGMGERLVRFTLDTLRDPEARNDIMSLARTGVSAGHAVTGLQDFIEVGVVDRVAGIIGVPDARMRSALITSYLMGVAIMRYGVRLEPLASASDEEVIRIVAPVIQDLLDPRHPIPGSDRDRAEAPRPMATGQEPEQPTSRTRTFDPDPAATRARKAAALAKEAELVRERAEADRRASTSGAGGGAGGSGVPKKTSARKSQATRKPSAAKATSTRKSSTAKRPPSGKPPAAKATPARKVSQGHQAAPGGQGDQAHCAGEHGSGGGAGREEADDGEGQRPIQRLSASSDHGREGDRRPQRLGTEAWWDREALWWRFAVARGAVGGWPGSARRGLGPQWAVNSRAMAEVVAWSTRPSCQAIVTASTAFST